MANNAAYIGEELKYVLTLEAPGFNMNHDEYEIIVSCGKKQIKYTQDDIFMDVEGNHYLVIDTSGFKKGDLYATVYAYVPDTDFPDGKRTEIDRQKLCALKDFK